MAIFREKMLQFLAIFRQSLGYVSYKILILATLSTYLWSRFAAFVVKIVKNVQIVACEHVRVLPNL